MSWHDTRKMLHEDHRWQLTKLLDKAEKQSLFEEHVAALMHRNRTLFRRVIDEFVNPVELMTITWRDVRRLIKDDPRFAKFSSSDRVCNLFFLFFRSCFFTSVSVQKAVDMWHAITVLHAVSFICNVSHAVEAV